MVESRQYVKNSHEKSIQAGDGHHFRFLILGQNGYNVKVLLSDIIKHDIT